MDQLRYIKPLYLERQMSYFVMQLETPKTQQLLP